ncbi:PhzF family phenazine biosynthesis protein [Streptomyces sp. NPDC031705]|uniref:PhzF family phenazine biosynthesis protein n=1 Tax=Streptomyces sp. NPDC031705 TaxID=3155729 RepID=UPI0033F5707E
MTGGLRLHHVDVFAAAPYGGNGLTVFHDAGGLDGALMQRITREFRQFESAFLSREPVAGGAAGHRWRARVFDLAEELDFAGHPLLGAAGVLHHLFGAGRSERWELRVGSRTVPVDTERTAAGRYSAVLDQGAPMFLGRSPVLGLAGLAGLAGLFGLDVGDLDPDLPPEVVDTGLRYLVVPVRNGALARARPSGPLAGPLAELGARYAYLLDAAVPEGRHWHDDGLLEDVATGSGAGCAAGYLRRHSRIADGAPVTLHQGRFTGRPSRLTVTAHGSPAAVRSVRVGGPVTLVAEGRLYGTPLQRREGPHG